MNINDRICAGSKRLIDQFRSKSPLIDCCVQHDDGCRIFAGGSCNCSPDITLTCTDGKFSVGKTGLIQKLGAEGEAIPVIYDPRPNTNN